MTVASCISVMPGDLKVVRIKQVFHFSVGINEVAL